LITKIIKAPLTNGVLLIAKIARIRPDSIHHADKNAAADTCPPPLVSLLQDWFNCRQPAAQTNR
jgi:hypothetical protein